MTMQDFIFSEKVSYKVKRHALFWLVYGSFFYLQSVTPEVISVLYHSNAFYFAWVSFYSYMPACILSVYVFLYFLFPRYLQKKKYISFVIAVFALFVVLNVINFYMAQHFFRITCNCKMEPLMVFGYGNNNAFLAVAIGLFAVGIKFAKEWYIEQRQLMEANKLMAKTELLSVKTIIHPGFLFDSLKKLENILDLNPSSAPGYTLLFSDILSYTLYDCDQEHVPLKKELAAVSDYISLQKSFLTYKIDSSLELYQTGDNLVISPCLLLDFLQDCFGVLEKENIEKLDCLITVNGTELRFLFGTEKEHDSANAQWEEIFVCFENKLGRAYPGNYELKYNHVTQNILVDLNLKLSEADTTMRRETKEINAA